MTGFARVTGQVNGLLTWTLTMKSVNHRYLDLHMRIPSGAESIEMLLRRRCKEKIIRGHLEITLNLERSAGVTAGFDQKLLQAHIAAFRQAAEQNGLDAEPDLNQIFRLPGVLVNEGPSNEEEMRSLEVDVAARLDSLFAALNTMRVEEGKALVEALITSMERLDRAVLEAGRLRQDVQNAYFERIHQRISSLLNGGADRERILQEAALLAERSDVEEEVTRLRAHIRQFRSILDDGGEIGKKLDFLLQEMNREANTLLSKTAGVAGNGQRITELGLQMKSEIEKAREQVQNLE